MPRYVKGFKIDRQKIANKISAADDMAPLVEVAIQYIIKRLDRLAYERIECGYEPPDPDGERHLSIIIALAYGNDKDQLEKMDLGKLDASIQEALGVLVGPDVWELWE